MELQFELRHATALSFLFLYKTYTYLQFTIENESDVSQKRRFPRTYARVQPCVSLCNDVMYITCPALCVSRYLVSLYTCILIAPPGRPLWCHFCPPKIPTQPPRSFVNSSSFFRSSTTLLETLLRSLAILRSHVTCVFFFNFLF